MAATSNNSQRWAMHTDLYQKAIALVGLHAADVVRELPTPDRPGVWA